MAEDRLPRYLEQVQEIKKEIEEFKSQFEGTKMPGRRYATYMSTYTARVKAIWAKIQMIGKKHNIVMVCGTIKGKEVRLYYSDISTSDVIDLVRVENKSLTLINVVELIPGNPYYLNLHQG